MNDLNLSNLIKLMQFRPTLKETANWFSVSEDTIERKIKKFAKCTFREFKLIHSGQIKIKLQEKAIEMAMSGNTSMMIFALKNLCDWVDKKEVSNANDYGQPFHIAVPGQPDTDFPEGAKVIRIGYDPRNMKDPSSV